MEAIRLDVFLWATRKFKTRSLASDFCKKDRVKVNGIVAKASRKIYPGDMLEVVKPPVHYQYKVIRVLKKRIGAKLVDDYLEDLTPQEELDKLLIINSGGFYYRDKGSGRPTKKERRILDKYTGEED